MKNQRQNIYTSARGRRFQIMQVQVPRIRERARSTGSEQAQDSIPAQEHHRSRNLCQHTNKDTDTRLRNQVKATPNFTRLQPEAHLIFGNQTPNTEVPKIVYKNTMKTLNPTP